MHLRERPASQSLRQVRIKPQRVIEKADRLVEVVQRHPCIERGLSAHGEIDRIGVGRPLAHRAQGLGVDELDAERVGDARDRLDLQFAELAALALEPVGPDDARRSRSRRAAR